MTDVFVLDYGDYDHRDIGAYSSLDAAQKARPLHPDCEPYRDVPENPRTPSHGHAWYENQYGAWVSPACNTVDSCSIQAFELDKQPDSTPGRLPGGTPYLDVT